MASLGTVRLTRRALLGSAMGVVLAAVAAPALAQATPDLSGTCLLDEMRSDPAAVTQARAGRGGRGVDAQSTADVGP